MTTPSLRAFMTQIIDYAGLFPPSRLPFDTAIENFLRYRTEPDAWMLARFICPVNMLSDINGYRSRLSDDNPLRLSVLGRSAVSEHEFRTIFMQDLQAVVRFKQELGKLAEIEVFEVRLPTEMVEHHNPSHLADLLHMIREQFDSIMLGHVMPFVEGSMAGNWSENLEYVVATIRDINRQTGATRPPIGYKLRCGGVEPEAFPTSEQVVTTIRVCHEHGVPLKATAGLHHPVRHDNDSIPTKMHGFLNVFGAGILTHHHDLSPAEIQRMIEDETAAHFQFSEETMRWQEYDASCSQIEQARQMAVTSFGSCSFDEPREDLRELGLL